MTASLEIRNQQKRVLLSLPRIQRIIRKILDAEDILQAALSVAFVTDHQIRILNKRFLQKDWPTDVLAFDFQRGRRPPSTGAGLGKRVEGEIVVSTGAAARNAREFATSPYRETILYVVHGLLHLLGYDDHRPKDVARMRARENEIMELLDQARLTRPPRDRGARGT